MPGDYALKDDIEKYPLKLPSKIERKFGYQSWANTLNTSYDGVFHIFYNDAERKKLGGWICGWQRIGVPKNHNFSANGGTNNE